MLHDESLPAAAPAPNRAAAAEETPGLEGDASAPAPAAPEIPPIADGRERQLDPRSIALDRTVGWIGALVLAFVSAFGVMSTAIAALLSGRGSWLAIVVLAAGWVGVNGAAVWLAHQWPTIVWRHTSYRVDERGIEIRRGVFWQRAINVPRSRVQHTDVSQGPLERRFGLGTLVVFTAGTDHAKVALAGLDHGMALRIREHLLPGGDSDAV